jgi:hypothetical protein
VIDAGTPDELKDRAGRDVIEGRPRHARDLSDVDTQRACVPVSVSQSGSPHSSTSRARNVRRGSSS